MKEKWILAILCLFCALLLIGCGDTPAPAPSAAPSAALPDEVLKPDVTEAPTAKEEALALAKSFEGKDLSELVEAIGEPISADYVPSCMGSGNAQDGELKYDGFIVITYREGSSETVTYVQAAD